MTTAIPPTRVGSIYGSQFIFRNLAKGGFGLQQRIAVIAQGNTATTYAATKLQVFDAQTAGETYGFGSPIHSIVEQLLPRSGDGVGDIPVTIYPLVDGTTPAAATITPVGSPTAAGTYTVRISRIASASFVIPASASVADATALLTTVINGELRMPTIAADGTTVCNLTCKWGGLTGNDLVVLVEGPALGMTFTVVQHASGAGDPAIDAAVLDQFGTVWETCIVNALGGTTPALDALAAHNEGRWAPTVGLFVHGAYYASVETDVATAITVPDARGTDRTNVQLPAPGSENLPWAIAARQVARIAKVANSSSPASGYNGQLASGLTPGLPAVQWDDAQRETAVTSGTSTSVVQDGVIQLDDIVTMYHPSGDPTPAYRYVSAIVRLQQVQNDLKQKFNVPAWKGAPLIPDGQATTDRAAKTPSMAATEIMGLIDSWALKALISDPETAKETVFAGIDGGNNNRLNTSFTLQLSGNTNIISTDVFFGFFFGQGAAA